MGYGEARATLLPLSREHTAALPSGRGTTLARAAGSNARACGHVDCVAIFVLGGAAGSRAEERLGAGRVDALALARCCGPAVASAWEVPGSSTRGRPGRGDRRHADRTCGARGPGGRPGRGEAACASTGPLAPLDPRDHSPSRRVDRRARRAAIARDAATRGPSGRGQSTRSHEPGSLVRGSGRGCQAPRAALRAFRSAASSHPREDGSAPLGGRVDGGECP